MKKKREPHLRIYRDRKGELRFSIRAANGRIVTASTEGYKTKSALRRALVVTWQALGVWAGEGSIIEVLHEERKTKK